MCFSLSLNIHGEDEKIDSYTVSIPSGVSLSKDNTSNTLNISGNLDSYNTLSINISSSNGYKLKHKTTDSYSIAYTLNKTSIYVESNDSSKDFSENISVSANTSNIKAGKYSDTLTFTISANPKTVTVNFHNNDGSDTVTSKDLLPNTAYGSLPTLVREDYIFNGWYYLVNDVKVFISEDDTFNPKFTEYYADWIEDESKATLISGSNFNKLLDQTITSIVFTNSAMPNDINDYSDVSLKQDGSVLAYKDETILKISPKKEGTTIYANKDCSTMFKNAFASSITFDNFNTSKVTNMAEMFYSCSNIKKINVTNFDTSNVTNMNHMFDTCDLLSSLDLSSFDTSKLTFFEDMLDYCLSLKEIKVGEKWNKNIEFPYLTSSNGKWYKDGVAYNYDEIPSGKGAYTSNRCLTLLSGRKFQSAIASLLTNATSITFSSDAMPNNIANKVDVSADLNGSIYAYLSNNELIIAPDQKASLIYANSDCSYMFSGLEVNKIVFDNFHTSKAINMYGMFYEIENIKTIDLSDFDTTSVTDMGQMFYASSFETIDISGLDTSNVTSMREMFSVARSLKEIDLQYFDLSKVNDYYNMFSGCDSLSKIQTGENWNKDIEFAHSGISSSGKWYFESSLSYAEYNKIPQGENTYYAFAPTRITIENDALKLALAKAYSAHKDINELRFAYGPLPFYIKKEETYPASKDGKLVVYVEDNAVIVTPKEGHTFIEGSTNSSGLFAYDKDNTTIADTNETYDVLDTSKLETIDLTNFYSSNITDMSLFFSGCSSLKTLNMPNITCEKATTLEKMFEYCSNLTLLNLQKLNTSNVTNMSRMFYDCSSISYLDLADFNTKNVTDMYGMFYGCDNLETIDLSGFDTDKVTDMSFMFKGCVKLKSINVSNFLTSKVEDMESMFQDCTSLKSINVSSFDTHNVTDMKSMFEGCTSLETIYDDGGFFAKTNVGSDMFKDCTKLVGGGPTVYNASKVNEEYAKVGTYQQEGYFTNDSKTDIYFFYDDDQILVKSYNVNKAYDVLPDELDKDGYKFIGWYYLDNNQKVYISNTDIYDGKITKVYAHYIPASEKIISGEEFRKLITDDVTSIEFVSSAMPSTITTYTDISLDKDGSVLAYEDGSVLKISPKYDDVVICANEDVTNMFNTKDISKANLTSIKFDNFNTSNVKNMSYMFANCSSLKEVSLESFDTSKVTSMNYMFYNCSSLTSIDLSGLNTSSLKLMNYMFHGCSSLANINLKGIDISHVEEMYHLFYYCSSLTSIDLDGLNFSNVKYMMNMFRFCNSLTSVDFSKAIPSNNLYDIDSMFSDCKSLTYININNFKTSKLTFLGNLFSDCNSLETIDLSNLDFNHVTKTQYMFYNCKNLKTIYMNNLNKSIINNSDGMFMHCDKLVGGLGTKFDSSKIDITYANIDGGTSNPGYFNNYFNLTFDYDDGTSNIVTKRVSLGETYSDFIPDTNRDGYKFLGWYYLDGDNQKVFIDTSAIYKGEATSFKAEWTLSEVTLISGANFKNTIPSNAASIEFTSEAMPSDVTSYRDLSDEGNGLLLGYTDGTTYKVSPKYSGVTILANVDCNNMFDSDGASYKLTSISFNNFDTKNVTSMNRMFWYCNYLTSLDLSKFDTSNVSDMSEMFNKCINLTSINLSNFNTTNVKTMMAMFSHCENIEQLDLSSFDTQNLISTQVMFQSCSKLKTIYANNFDTSKIIYSDLMFVACKSLVGENGTTYSDDHANIEYARVDTSDSPGYFTSFNNIQETSNE